MTWVGYLVMFTAPIWMLGLHAGLMWLADNYDEWMPKP